MSENSNNSAIRELAGGASIIYVGLVVEMGVAFLAQLLAARYLSLDGFGGLTAGTAVLNFGAIIGTLGMSEGLTRYLPRTGANERTPFVRTAFLVSIPISFVLGLGCVLTAPIIATKVFGDSSIVGSLYVFGAAIPFASILTLSLGGIRGLEIAKYRVYLKNLIQPTVRFTLVLLAVVFGLGQFGFALAYAIPYVATAVIGAVILYRCLEGSGKTSLSKSQLVEFLDYSVPMTFSKAASFIYRSADIFIILYLLDSASVGTYGVAYAAARLILMLHMAFNFLGAPIASRIESTEGIDGMFKAYRPLLRWLTVASAIMLFPFVLFPEEFISTVYRQRYVAGSSSLTVLAVGFAAHNVLGAQSNLLRGIGASRELALNGAVAAIVNIFLNLMLIPRHGILGAAGATAVSYLLMDLMMMVELRWRTGRYILSREIFIPPVLLVPTLYVGWHVQKIVPSTPLWAILISAIALLLYLSLVLIVVGVSDNDIYLVELAGEVSGLPSSRIVNLLKQLQR